MWLADLLDAIVLVADHPIKYSILDDGIVFSTRDSNSASLETRTFKVDANVFLAALQKQTGLQTNVSAAMRQFLSNVGVDLSPPKSIYFNETRGMLFIHATKQDLDVVEKAVQVLTYTPPPQIHIKARFIEVPGPAAANIYLGSVDTSAIYPAPDDIPQPTRDTINQPKSLIGVGTAQNSFTGIMSESQFQTALRALQSNPESEILAEPEVTTTSGRQTQMRVTDILTIITNFVFQETSTNAAITPQQSQVEIGPVFDAVASVLPDGCTLDLKMTATVTEFLGYDQPTNSILVNTLAGTNVMVPTGLPRFHLPRFRVRQAVTQLKLWDNQTVVLGGLQDRLVPGGKEVDVKPGSEVHKQLLVFVTVTLVDRVGNRIHSDDEMPFARKSIPPQDSH